MATPDTPPTLTMKLHIDTATRRVVFAETTKAAVDYLHSLIESHHVVSLDDDATVSAGCAHNLHDSVKELAAEAASAPLLRPPPKKRRRIAPSPVVAQAKRVFECGFNRGPACADYVTEKSGVACPSCGRPMATAVPDGEPGAGCSASAGESAPGPPPVRCLLMDDLSVTPMDWFGDTMATMFLGSIAAVQESTVQLGFSEGLAILDASLRSRTALSDAFVREKAPILPTYHEEEEEDDDFEEEVVIVEEEGEDDDEEEDQVAEDADEEDQVAQA